MKRLLALLILFAALTVAGFASVTVSSPTNGATVQSPVKFVASAASYRRITGMTIYVDSKNVYSTQAASLNTSIAMSAGTHAIVVKAWNSQGTIYSDSMTLAVTSATSTSAVKVSTASLANATAGSAYTATLQASGGTSPYSWSLASGSLPAGLSLSASGAINGTPSASCAPSFSVAVKDSEASPQTATATLSITVAASPAPAPAALKLTTSTLASGTAGSGYSATLQASGGTSPYTWSLASGSLPSGLSLSSSGIISGTPSASGTSSFSVNVKDSEASPQTTTAALSLTIATSAPAPAALKLTTSTLASGTAGSGYTTTLQATGGTSPYTWSLASGSLPSGLALSGSGTVSGTPSASGTSSFSVTVKDSESSPQAATTALSLNIAAATPVNASCSGNCYYISPSGSDSNSGTSTSAPWKTVTHACATVAAGSTVIVLPGTYSENPSCSKSGTAGSPITIQAEYPATLNTSNRSIFSSTSSGGNDNQLWTLTGNYETVIGFEITGVNASWGILAEGNYDTMQSNVVHDVGTSISCSSDGGAGLGDPVNYTNEGNQYLGNVIYNIGPGATTPSSSTCLYYHGIYHANHGGLIYNNIVSNSGAGCLSLNHDPQNVVVSNNTFFNCGNAGFPYAVYISNEGSYPVPDYLFFANNIIYNSMGGIEEDVAVGAHNYYLNNDMYNISGTSWKLNGGHQVNSLTVNPGFANYVSTGGAPIADYEAASGSSGMVGAGISNTTAATYNSGVSGEQSGSVPTNDIMGNSRPTGANSDLGAYQH